jgi:pilus assembly protein Flp/PilA
MEYLMRTIAKFLKDESGSNAAEYALIIALVAGVIAVAVALLGTNISTELKTIAGSI